MQSWRVQGAQARLSHALMCELIERKMQNRKVWRSSIDKTRG